MKTWKLTELSTWCLRPSYRLSLPVAFTRIPRKPWSVPRVADLSQFPKYPNGTDSKEKEKVQFQ